MNIHILAKVLHSRNEPGDLVEMEDIFILRPASSTEFRAGSCCDSEVGWGPRMCKVLPGCIIAHSQTPTHVHGTAKLR